MKTIQVKEAYRCEFCNKLYLSKKWCKEHEIGCSQNPENDRSCFICMHSKKRVVTRTVDTFHGEGRANVKVFHCDEINSYIYPPKVNNPYNGSDLEYVDGEELDNVPMRKTCKLLKLF